MARPCRAGATAQSPAAGRASGAAGAALDPVRLNSATDAENAENANAETIQAFDIWESQQAFDKFGETLMPIAQEMGVDLGQPMVEPVHNLIQG